VLFVYYYEYNYSDSKEEIVQMHNVAIVALQGLNYIIFAEWLDFQALVAFYSVHAKLL
jgi:hypothetical protein